MIVAAGRTVSTQNTAGDHVKTSSRVIRSSNGSSSRIAQDESGGQLHVVPLGRAHRAVAKEIRRKELTSMTKEASTTGDESGKENSRSLHPNSNSSPSGCRESLAIS